MTAIVNVVAAAVIVVVIVVIVVIVVTARRRGSFVLRSPSPSRCCVVVVAVPCHAVSVIVVNSLLRRRRRSLQSLVYLWWELGQWAKQKGGQEIRVNDCSDRSSSIIFAKCKIEFAPWASIASLHHATYAAPPLWATLLRDTRTLCAASCAVCEDS